MRQVKFLMKHVVIVGKKYGKIANKMVPLQVDAFPFISFKYFFYHIIITLRTSKINFPTSNKTRPDQYSRTHDSAVSCLPIILLQRFHLWSLQ